METRGDAATVRVDVPAALPLRPPAHRPDRRAITWWRLRALVMLLVLTVPLLIALPLLDWPGWLTAVTIATGVLCLAYTVAVPVLRFRIHRWEVTDQAVYTRTGWLVREWRIAPISRVQTVDTEHGPLQQLLRLATVTVTTASARGAVEIAGLDADAAAELARDLTETTHATPGDAT